MRRGLDSRYLMAAGLLLMAAGNCWMAIFEFEHQPLASRLAAGGDDRRPLDVRSHR